MFIVVIFALPILVQCAITYKDMSPAIIPEVKTVRRLKLRQSTVLNVRADGRSSHEVGNGYETPKCDGRQNSVYIRTSLSTINWQPSRQQSKIKMQTNSVLFFQ